MSPAAASSTAAPLACASHVATTTAAHLALLLLLLLPRLQMTAQASTGTASSTTPEAATTTLPGVRFRCYVCDPCSLDGSVSTANANNQSVCEQCGKSIVGYLGTVTRISRQCYRREDASYLQCSTSSSSDAKQLCCASGDYCNGCGRLATASPWLLLLLQLLLPLARGK